MCPNQPPHINSLLRGECGEHVGGRAGHQALLHRGAGRAQRVVRLTAFHLRRGGGGGGIGGRLGSAPPCGGATPAAQDARSSFLPACLQDSNHGVCLRLRLLVQPPPPPPDHPPPHPPTRDISSGPQMSPTSEGIAQYLLPATALPDCGA